MIFKILVTHNGSNLHMCILYRNASALQISWMITSLPALCNVDTPFCYVRMMNFVSHISNMYTLCYPMHSCTYVLSFCVCDWTCKNRARGHKKCDYFLKFPYVITFQLVMLQLWLFQHLS